MKTFTLKDLDCRPALVQDACDQEGAVRIRRPNGRKYTLQADDAAPRKMAWRKLVAEHRARIKRIFPVRLTTRQTRLVDQSLAGE